MTLLSQLMSWFPALVMAIAAICLWEILVAPSIFSISALIFTLYCFPLLIYYLHQRFYPVQPGISYLKTPQYNPWWGSHQIQMIYNAFPLLEIILRLIPGLFSLWLRLWGAKIGNQVYWTPSVNIIDRGLLEVGDRVVLGHMVETSSHAIKPKKDDLLLYVQNVTIGNDVFIGADAKLGPGAKIADGTYLPLRSTVYPGQKIEVEECLKL